MASAEATFLRARLPGTDIPLYENYFDYRDADAEMSDSIAELKDKAAGLQKDLRQLKAPRLRKQRAAYLKRRFAVKVDPDTEVLATLGSRECLFHLPMTFVEVPSDKDLVLYGEPAWPVYESGALFAEAWTYAVPLGSHNGYAMDPDALPESVLRRASVVFLNYPHNPTGFCLPDELFRRWVAVREEYGFVLVNDEGSADLHYEGPAPRSLRR